MGAARPLISWLRPRFASAQADDSDKPIRLLVVYLPGGSVDVIARVFAQKLKDSLRRAVAVENRVGAGGTIAGDFVTRGDPDGHRQRMQSTGAIGASLAGKTFPYNVVRDNTPNAYVRAAPRVLALGPSVQARTVEELLKSPRAKASDLKFASEGNETRRTLAWSA